jgi:hypothetical protein
MKNDAYSFRRFSAFPCGRLFRQAAARWLSPGGDGRLIRSPKQSHGKRQKKYIKAQVETPGHMAEYAAAGTGHAVPEAHQHQAGIHCEGGQHGQRKPQPPGLPAPAPQQAAGQQFGRRQRPGQRAGHPPGNILIVKLRPESLKIQQFAHGGISKQQDQQRYTSGDQQWTGRKSVRFHKHGNDLIATKYARPASPKQYDFGSIPLNQHS